MIRPRPPRFSPPRQLLAGFLGITLGCGGSSLPAHERVPLEQWGFSAPWDRRSAATIRAHGAKLDGVVLAWMSIDSASLLPVSPYIDSLSAALPPATRRMALLTTWQGDRFRPEMVRRLAADSVALDRSATAVAERLRAGGYRGLVVDFEEMTPRDTALTRAVVAAYARAVRRRDAGPVVVAVPATDTAGYPARLFPSADLLLVMLYDQHWAGSAPGAISAPAWVRRSLAMRVAEGGASRLVAALPLYGYAWRRDGPATPISYDEARRMATETGVALDRDPSTATLHATRAGAGGWELWVSDAVLADTLRREVAAFGVRRVAWWRLGTEDAAFWRSVRR